MLLQYGKYIPSTWLRRKIVDMVPDANAQRLKYVVDTLYSSSLAIYQAKKEAFLRGDEAVHQQVGRGKDIMSILRESLSHCACIDCEKLIP